MSSGAGSNSTAKNGGTSEKAPAKEVKKKGWLLKTRLFVDYFAVDHWQEIDDHILPDNQCLRECGGGGHCAYHVCAHHGLGDYSRWLLLRHLVADVLEDDKLLQQCAYAFVETGQDGKVVRAPTLSEIKLDLLVGNKLLEPSQPVADIWPRYIHEVRHTRIHATTGELRILAVLLETDITIVTPHADHVQKIQATPALPRPGLLGQCPTVAAINIVPPTAALPLLTMANDDGLHFKIVVACSGAEDRDYKRKPRQPPSHPVWKIPHHALDDELIEELTPFEQFLADPSDDALRATLLEACRLDIRQDSPSDAAFTRWLHNMAAQVTRSLQRRKKKPLPAGSADSSSSDPSIPNQDAAQAKIRAFKERLKQPHQADVISGKEVEEFDKVRFQPDDDTIDESELRLPDITIPAVLNKSAIRSYNGYRYQSAWFIYHMAKALLVDKNPEGREEGLEDVDMFANGVLSLYQYKHRRSETAGPKQLFQYICNWATIAANTDLLPAHRRAVATVRFHFETTGSLTTNVQYWRKVYHPKRLAIEILRGLLKLDNDGVSDDDEKTSKKKTPSKKKTRKAKTKGGKGKDEKDQSGQDDDDDETAEDGRKALAKSAIWKRVDANFAALEEQVVAQATKETKAAEKAERKASRKSTKHKRTASDSEDEDAKSEGDGVTDMQTDDDTGGKDDKPASASEAKTKAQKRKRNDVFYLIEQIDFESLAAFKELSALYDEVIAAFEAEKWEEHESRVITFVQMEEEFLEFLDSITVTGFAMGWSELRTKTYTALGQALVKSKLASTEPIGLQIAKTVYDHLVGWLAHRGFNQKGNASPRERAVNGRLFLRVINEFRERAHELAMSESLEAAKAPSLADIDKAKQSLRNKIAEADNLEAEGYVQLFESVQDDLNAVLEQDSEPLAKAKQLCGIMGSMCFTFRYVPDPARAPKPKQKRLLKAIDDTKKAAAEGDKQKAMDAADKAKRIVLQTQRKRARELQETLGDHDAESLRELGEKAHKKHRTNEP